MLEKTTFSLAQFPDIIPLEGHTYKVQYTDMQSGHRESGPEGAYGTSLRCRRRTSRVRRVPRALRREPLATGQRVPHAARHRTPLSAHRGSRENTIVGFRLIV